MPVRVSVTGQKFITSDPIELVQPRLGGVSPAVEQYAPHPSGTKFLFLDNVGDERNLSIGLVTELAVARATIALSAEDAVLSA